MPATRTQGWPGGAAQALARRARRPALAAAAGAAALIAGSGVALAQEEAGLDSGDTAWMLTSTALVLMMTVPGLALFYCGMVRRKNVLSATMQVFATCCLATLVWIVIGYSLAFSGEGPLIGDLGRFLLNGMTVDSLSGTIPESLFMTFQMTFAIITPALITGAVRRPDEVLGAALVHRPVERARLSGDRALGLGHRRLGP